MWVRTEPSPTTVPRETAELAAPAPHGCIAEDHPALKQQLFNVTKAELEPKIPAHCTTDDGCRKTTM
jgi:hypothetical protein